jgi:hypothetical protein
MTIKLVKLLDVETIKQQGGLRQLRYICENVDGRLLTAWTWVSNNFYEDKAINLEHFLLDVAETTAMAQEEEE